MRADCAWRVRDDVGVGAGRSGAKDSPIIWSSVSTVIILFGAMAAFGLVLRLRGQSFHIASMFFVVGLFPIFGSLVSIATKLAFPLQRPLIDAHLFAIDRVFGYEWDKAVEMLATSPGFAWLLSVIYLGLTKRGPVLHHFLLTAMLTSVMTLAIWLVWPSFGPSAFLSLAPEVSAAAGLVVTPEYGARLMDMAANGLTEIDAHLALGAIAFPSYHIIMAIMVVWFARGTLVFLPALAINLLMIAATLTHGGHHLIDLAGGAVCFAIACALAKRLLHEPPKATRQPMLAVS